VEQRDCDEIKLCKILYFVRGMGLLSHVKWVPYHHGMACRQVAGRGNGLQIWTEAANILNKQSRTAGRGWLFSLGVGQGANNPPP
jgi:hypothetical protein